MSEKLSSAVQVLRRKRRREEKHCLIGRWMVIEVRYCLLVSVKEMEEEMLNHWLQKEEEGESDGDVRQQMRAIKHMGSFLRGVTDPCFPDRGTQACLGDYLHSVAQYFWCSFTQFAPTPSTDHHAHLKNQWSACLSVCWRTGTILLRIPVKGNQAQTCPSKLLGHQNSHCIMCTLTLLQTGAVFLFLEQRQNP